VASVTAPPAPAGAPGATRWRKTTIAVLWTLVVAFIAIRLWNLTTFCLDSDEIFSLLCTRGNLGYLLHAVKVDVVHPPLFYIVLWLWVHIGGESLLWLRLLPFLTSVLALIPAWIVLDQLRLSYSARIIALFLLAVNDYQVFHARYVRMYALLFLLSLVSVALFNASLERLTPRRSIALAAVNLLMVYTQYYGWMVVGVEGLYLLVAHRDKFRSFLTGALVDACLFLPWALAATQAAIAKGGLSGNLGWIRHPKIGDLWWYYAGCNGPLWPVLLTSAMVFLVFFPALAAGSWWVFRCSTAALEQSRLRFAALLAFFPPSFTCLISNFLRNSVWGNRHLIVSALPYMALLGAAMVALRPKWLRVIVISVATAWGLYGAYRVTLSPEPRNNLEVLTRQLVGLNRRISPQTTKPTVYFLDPYLAFPVNYYLESDYHLQWRLLPAASVAEISGDRVWVGYNHKSWKGAEPPQDLLRHLGYKIGPGAWSSDRWDRIAVFLAYRDHP
jgi:hypothetical protein